jgi:hypothetical protein
MMFSKKKIVSPVAMSEAAYYKLKARVLEIQIDQERLQQAQALVAQKREIAYRDAGLDPTKNYTLVDATHAVQDVVPTAPTGGDQGPNAV